MLNASALLFNAGGRVRNTATGPADAFNASVPTRAGLLYIALAGPAAYVNGLPLVSSGSGGALCFQAGATVGFSTGGLPIAASGGVAVDTGGAIDHYSNGLPFTAADRLCLAVAE